MSEESAMPVSWGYGSGQRPEHGAAMVRHGPRRGVMGKVRHKPLAILCVSMLVLTWLPLEVSAAVPNGSHKIVVDSKDTSTLVQLARGGATLLADYGSFSVWRTNDTQRQSVAARSS